jgi:cytochrome c3-like protein/doubled CXXCH motif protein
MSPSNNRTPLLLALALIGSLAASPVAVAATPDNSSCRQCHLPGSHDQQAPKLDFKLAAGSAHGGLSCTECHSSSADLPHRESLPKVDCLACHGDQLDVAGTSVHKYGDSAHGRARDEAGGEDAASCVDCHGKHDIRGHDDPASLVYRGNIPRTCARCHEDNQVVLRHDIRFEQPYHEYEQSIHGKALLKDGLLKVAAICTDCHGVHAIQSHLALRPMASQPETCGSCHITVYNTYHQSIHGRLHIDENNMDSPGCTDCHGEHGILSPERSGAPTSQTNIPKTCSSCHADAVKMGNYDVDTDKLATYKQSFHGVAQGLGDQNAANCASCHGYHTVYPANDPRSKVHPDNMLKTCSECHPKATENFVNGRIHVDPTSSSSGALYYLRTSLVWLVYITLGALVLWVALDINRRLRKPRNGR